MLQLETTLREISMIRCLARFVPGVHRARCENMASADARLISVTRVNFLPHFETVGPRDAIVQCNDRQPIAWQPNQILIGRYHAWNCQ
ncbi:hypothetical protein MHY1_01746 [Methylovirgula sp. HY1]|nr:hypothetical protein MHY1_01746 [Methylovirgula sp. HY1]